MRKLSRTAIVVFALALTGVVDGCAVRIPFLSFPEEREADATPARAQAGRQEQARAGRTAANVTAARGGQSGYTAGLSSAGTVTAPKPENPLTATLKKASQSITKALTIKPRVFPPEDPTRLASDPGPISADLYVSAARLTENRGDFAAAQQQYEKALQIETDCLAALVGLSRLYHRQGRMDEAIRMCRRAVEVHPESGLAHNDLGLCYARQMQVDRAIESLSAAVQLEPESKLYRNNLAAALVLAGRIDEARMHLAQIHGAAIAEYNLGYLLHKLGKTDAARDRFRRALQFDPELRPAAQMLMRYRSQDPVVHRSPRRALTRNALPVTPEHARNEGIPGLPQRDRFETQQRAPSAPPAIADVPPTRAQAAPPIAEQRVLPPVEEPARSWPPASPANRPQQSPDEARPSIQPDEPPRPWVEPPSDNEDTANDMTATDEPSLSFEPEEGLDHVQPLPPVIEEDGLPPAPERNVPPAASATSAENLPHSWYTGDFSFVPRRIAPPKDELQPQQPPPSGPAPDARYPAPIWLSPEDR